jgi:hypothetical protein
LKETIEKANATHKAQFIHSLLLSSIIVTDRGFRWQTKARFPAYYLLSCPGEEGGDDIKAMMQVAQQLMKTRAAFKAVAHPRVGVSPVKAQRGSFFSPSDIDFTNPESSSVPQPTPTSRPKCT